MKTKVINFVYNKWRELFFLFVGVGVFCALYGYRLGSFLPGHTTLEQPQYLGLARVEIVNDIAFAPLKILQAIMLKIDDPNSTLLRLTTVFCVALACAALYLVVSRWHTPRVALFTTLLFMGASLPLHLGRFANTDAYYLLAVPFIILIGNWLKTKRGIKRMPVAALMAAGLLYVPGMWLVTGAIGVLFYKRLLLAWRFTSLKTKLLSANLFAIGIIPLIIGLVKNPKQINELSGLPTTSPHQVLDNLVHLPSWLLYRGPNDPLFWLNGSPLIDVLLLVLVVIGLFSYRIGPHPLRYRLILGLLIVALGFVILGGSTVLALLLPLLYLVAANGIAYLLQSWFMVFPRNPIARSVGLSVLVFILALSFTYQTQRYFAAWRNAPPTKQAILDHLAR